MDKLSGLILDAGDDFDGSVIKSIYPTLEDVPSFIKSASQVDPAARQSLPDDVFALIMQDGDVTLRKFACVDEGNTVLNVQYFLKTAHKLPKAAQKQAAANLCHACSWYDIEPPAVLKKVAMGFGTMLQLGLMGPEAMNTAKSGVQSGMAAAKQSGGMINPAVVGGQGGQGPSPQPPQPPMVR